ncbi:serine/threonine protein kinase [Frankia sp. AiPs1]|uniref:protein kinase domain-containing protein n=1 Tax=Frankia sp. AiPs1 TaxID=573493 RepID=UPI0020447BE2|nr:serine/threonine-protein kinase [Frankia sp. AiPs1]MCM3922243.1 serine/threonine protein kinase [Frankia sp. AiPs1]
MTPAVGPLRVEDPTRIGAYTLRGRLGSGGMGMVYLASDPTGDPVAVKIIRPEVTGDPMFRDRFRREVTAARRVPRFCTAAVRDADPDGNPPYLVTDYVPGPTLTSAVRTTPLKGAELEQVAVNIATALAVIHGAGVVHRDLKPSNVLLSPSGARVIDFGIATAAGMTMLTLGQPIGTPEFMPPEAFDGAPPSPAGDIFAWGGVVLYAASRTPPFPYEPAALLPHRIRTDHPAHLHRLPEPLRGAVTAAMAKDPHQRPTADQLYRLLTGPASTANPRPHASPDDTGRWVPDVTRPLNPAAHTARPPTPPSPPAHPGTPPRRRRRTLIAGSLAVAAVLAAAAFTLRAEQHAGRGTLTAAQRTTAGRTLAAAAQNTTDPALAERLAVAAWHLNPAASGDALLTTTAGRLPPLSTAGHAGPITTAAITADGRTLATSSKDQTARLWDLTTPGDHPALLATLPHAAAVTAISLNPPGTLAATTSEDDTLHLWNIRNPDEPTPAGTYTLRGAGHPIAAVFSPAGTVLSLTTSTGALLTYDVTDPTHLTILSSTVHAHNDETTAQAIPNSTTLATASADGTARLWDLTDPHTPKPLSRITLTAAPLNLAISPDGHTFAAANADGTISLWNIRNPAAPEPLTTLQLPKPNSASSADTLTTFTNAASAVTFNPTSTLLAAATTTGTLYLWNITDPHNPHNPHPLLTLTTMINELTFIHDGTRILTASDDSTARLWDLNPTSLYRRACTTTHDQLTPDEWTRYLSHVHYQRPCPATTSPPTETHSAPP